MTTAAVEQLGEWAIRANVSIEVPTADERGGDPVPVVTRTVRRAKAEVSKSGYPSIYLYIYIMCL